MASCLAPPSASAVITTFSQTQPVAVPYDHWSGTARSDITVSGFDIPPANASAARVTATVSFDAPDHSSLDVWLRSPDGRTLTLMSGGTGCASDEYSTCPLSRMTFDDSAREFVPVYGDDNGTWLPTVRDSYGYYPPARGGALNSLLSGGSNGTWSLFVGNHGVPQTGTVTWEIALDNGDPPPTAPGKPGAAPWRNRGSFTLSWAPSVAAGNVPITYALERRLRSATAWHEVADGVAGTQFAVVPGAAGTDGTWVYRVVAWDGSRHSKASAVSAGVVVDREAPSRPSLSVQEGQSPAFVADDGTGWYRDRVAMLLADAGDPPLTDGSSGSGVAAYQATSAVTSDGLRTVTRSVKDRAGNVSDEASSTVAVDSRAPVLDLNCPTAPVARDSTAAVPFTASDASSGVAGPTAGDAPLDTTQSGKFTRAVTVVDRVGHGTTRRCSYTVR